jgi:hypothetical protein
LRARLARTHPEVTLINLAVEGYNIIQYRAVLEEVGLGLQPDLVVVAMFPVNDFELGDYENHRRIANGGEPRVPWYLSLYVYRGYLYRIPDLAVKAIHRIIPPAGTGAADAGWELNVAALKQINRIAQERKLPLAVALLPHTKGLETQRAIFARVRAVCAAEHLDCLDLLEAFRGMGVRDGALVLNAIDSHPNEAYHRMIVAPLEAGLAKRLPAATPAPRV